MPKSQHYVVWRGKRPGIYNSWADCRKQVDGFPGAHYKGFPTLEQARTALHDDPAKYMNKGGTATRRILAPNPLVGVPIADSICTDAACSGNPGVLEYRGVDTASGAQLFHMGPFPQGTVNLGEFLGIVHALAYLRQRNSDWPVYTDSKTAMTWIKRKAVNTKLEPSPKNQALFDLVQRAVKWLRENEWPNKVLKWETEYWGEIPADFGRK